MRIPTLAVVALSFTTIALSQETKIQRSDLPAAVEKAVAAQSANAAIKGFSREKENGQIYYETEMTTSGHSKDVLFDATGNVVEIEEQVALDSLPSEVKQGLQSKAGQGKILKVESITKHDKLVAYEAKVQNGSKKSEIQVGPDGKPLDHEE
jgi:Putative beta-lactamase-inhibitor-like, PepSY-like